MSRFTRQPKKIDTDQYLHGSATYRLVNKSENGRPLFNNPLYNLTSGEQLLNAMQGTEIVRLFDEYGPIYVYDDGPYRYMSFGSGGEQSRIERSRPAYPVYQYLQAMLLGLLYQPDPQRALMLGLGGGSLVHALLSYSDDLQISVAELRAQVLYTAREHFLLPDTPRLTITISDALDYLCDEATPHDLIFTDLFSDAGMQHLQLQQTYLQHCYRLLTDQGVLVLNLWDEGNGYHPEANQQLTELFGDNWLCCTIDSGNLIAFAFKGGKPESNPRVLMNGAKKLEKRLGFPARKLLNRLRDI